ncbi:universal stress protein [Accumulibacter sp.]|uniref:universal stress protein n=1 Tax=Accumulibacter sp. TaxID=2053492 RepID=UPI0028C46DD8|nr:universal stress protein [Accumulibacter sp.]
MNSLLVATDLSAPSRHAAQRAAMLARQTGARLVLAHVLEKRALAELLHLFDEDGQGVQDQIRAQAREALSLLAAEIGEPLGVSAGQHLLEGEVMGSISMQADLLDASLLVVGARGAGFMRHWLLGATAERLLRVTLRPILMVKQAPREAYRKVIVPMDFSPWSLGAVRLAMAVAPQAELILLHAYEARFEDKMRIAGVNEDLIQGYRSKAQQYALLRLKQTAAEAGLAAAQWQPLLTHGEAALGILEQEEEQGADLIVLGKHGVGMAEELLLGSVTKRVLPRARCDVLVAAR